MPKLPGLPVKAEVKADVRADLTEATKVAAEKGGDVVDDMRGALRAFGRPFAELFGLAGDVLAEKRRRWIGQMRTKTDAILAARGVEKPRPLPAAAAPQLAEATLGDDEKLQNLWAGLVANAQDPSRPVYSPSFGATLREFGPTETQVFLAVAAMTKRRLEEGKAMYDRELAALRKDLDKNKRDAQVGGLWQVHIVGAGNLDRPLIREEADVSAQAMDDALAVLQRLHVLQPGVRYTPGTVNIVAIPPVVRAGSMRLTDFGRALYRRCSGDDTELSP